MPTTTSPELKKKSDLHLTRKIWHATGVCLMAVCYHWLGHQNSWLVLGFATALVLTIDIVRQSQPELNQRLVKMFGPVMRTHEVHQLSGTSYLFLGALFLLIFDDPHILTLTLLFLAFGDPIASFFGIRYGKDKIIGNKTLQGTMAAFVVCALISLIYFYTHNLMIERLAIVVLLSGLIGAFAEIVPIGSLDDNLTFPVVSSLLLWVVFSLFGGFGP